MLAGRYPSDAFAELRPRLVWDRVTGELTARKGAQRLAVTSGGTIPDRGLFGVFLATGEGPGRRVGELDEEMVYESRVGDVFLLGSTSWRIEDITHDRVLVTPAPGQLGRMPFWKGDSPGRPVELGRALGAFLREVSAATPEDAAARARAAGLDEWGVANLLAYLREQREATRHLPDDRTVLVERFRDELGDWRLIVHSPFGAPVNAPWALAIAARLRERYGLDVSSMHSDDGIVLRLPDTDGEVPAGDLAVFEPDEIEALVTGEVSGSAVFASRFRECAARSLLLPRRDPRRRTPLWQQRQRANQLLQVASEYGDFPVVLEAMRECLQDVYDLPGLVGLMRDLQSRAVKLVEVETPGGVAVRAVAAVRLRRDVPVRGRRAARRATGPGAVARLRDAGRTARRDRTARAARRRVDRAGRARDRAPRPGPAGAGHRRGARPAARGRRPDHRRGDRARRDTAGPRRRSRSSGAPSGYGSSASSAGWRSRTPGGSATRSVSALPVGVPEAFTEPVKDPLGDLVSRYARTHGPFHTADVAHRFGLGVAVVAAALARLSSAGRVVQGEFLPHELAAVRVAGDDAVGRAVARVVRRRSAAAGATALARRAAQGGRAGPGRSRWRGSSRPGRASALARRAGSTACCVRSSSWPGCRCPRRRSSRWCCRRGSPTTPPRCSTS